MKGKIVAPILCVALIVGMFSGCVEEQVEANILPKASFTIELLTEIHVGTNINFTDTSTDDDGTIEAWSWNFGDENTSILQNSTHAYDSVGSYIVTLVVTDNGGNASEPFTMPIEVTYIVSFTYEPTTNITVNETIQFTANVTDDVANMTYTWDFGDDTTSNETNPTHNYTSAETYTVTLTVTDPDGAKGTATDTITVSEAEE